LRAIAHGSGLYLQKRPKELFRVPFDELWDVEKAFSVLRTGFVEKPALVEDIPRGAT
jgi:hypothetical protein